MRPQKRISAVLTGALMLASGPVSADLVRGQQLYEHHCQLCHQSSAHVRDNHKVKTADDLKYFVRRWSDYLKLDWSVEDRRDVEEFLDDAYYELEPVPSAEEQSGKAPCPDSPLPKEARAVVKDVVEGL